MCFKYCVMPNLQPKNSLDLGVVFIPREICVLFWYMCLVGYVMTRWVHVKDTLGDVQLDSKFLRTVHLYSHNAIVFFFCSLNFLENLILN